MPDSCLRLQIFLSFSFFFGVTKCSPLLVESGMCKISHCASHGNLSTTQQIKWLTLSKTIPAEPHSSVGSVADLRAGGRWFNPQLGQYSFQELMIVIATVFNSSLTAVHCFDNGYVEKQPGAWKEYSAEYWFPELQESMDRFTGHHDITEILLKKALNTIQSIKPKQSLVFTTLRNRPFEYILGKGEMLLWAKEKMLF